MGLTVFRHDNFILNSADNKIAYGFYGRVGGVSAGEYESLNCGIGSDDDADAVRQNRARVAADIGVLPPNLLSLYQIHSPECVTVTRPWEMLDRPQADAFVTDSSGIGLGILTADCVPVLFYGRKESGAPVIGAAHAGWKGALGGVLENTVSSMIQNGAIKDQIRVCVGPCISRNSYEVSYDFCEPFIEHHDEAVRFFQSGSKSGSLYFDLPAYCAWRLFQSGIKAITLMDKDTYSDAENFYSYRRMTHKGATEYGRQISVIAIKE